MLNILKLVVKYAQYITEPHVIVPSAASEALGCGSLCCKYRHACWWWWLRFCCICFPWRWPFHDPCCCFTLLGWTILPLSLLGEYIIKYYLNWSIKSLEIMKNLIYAYLYWWCPKIQLLYPFITGLISKVCSRKQQGCCTCTHLHTVS